MQRDRSRLGLDMQEEELAQTPVVFSKQETNV